MEDAKRSYTTSLDLAKNNWNSKSKKSPESQSFVRREALRGRALSFLVEGQQELALQDIDEARSLIKATEPQGSNLNIATAVVWLLNGRTRRASTAFKEVLDSCTQAIELAPSAYAHYYDAFICYVGLLDRTKATEMLELALERCSARGVLAMTSELVGLLSKSDDHRQFTKEFVDWIREYDTGPSPPRMGAAHS
jgi:tetratricopeptide (TPR) repeat protein